MRRHRLRRGLYRPRTDAGCGEGREHHRYSSSTASAAQPAVTQLLAAAQGAHAVTVQL